MVTKKPKGLGRGLEALLGPQVEQLPVVVADPDAALVLVAGRARARQDRPQARFRRVNTGLLTVLREASDHN